MSKEITNLFSNAMIFEHNISANSFEPTCFVFNGGDLTIQFKPIFDVKVKDGLEMSDAAKLFIESLRKLYNV